MQKDTNNNLKIIANRVVGGLVAAGGEKMSKQTKEILPNVFESKKLLSLYVRSFISLELVGRAQSP